ncbi:MAG: TonB-dependent receptor [Proteobacteria bacterium]|nr:TonB-dependent receptor [Pseudomonadota bacterium]
MNGAISTLTLDSVERVEVIKGPQSALFGRATFAGAINYVTKRPGDELAGKLSLTAGEDGDYRGSANISGPIIAEKLSFFLGASADTFDGQYRARRTDGSTMSIGATQTMGVEGGLFASPTDNLDIRLRVSYSESDDGFYADALQLSSANNFSLFNAVSNPYSPGYFRGTVKSDPSSFSNNCLEIEQLSAANGDRVTCGITTDTLRIHLVGDLDIGGWKLSQSVAYNEFNGRTVADGDYTAVFGVSGFIQLDFGSVMTDRAFETRLSSPASRRIRGSVGYYNYKKDEDDPQFRAFTSVGGCYAPKDLEDTNNQAVFGSVEMDLTETLIASIEARYGEDEKILNEGRVVTVARGTPQAFATSAAATFYSFTPRVTLSWNAAADTHLYAYAAKGNKPRIQHQIL